MSSEETITIDIDALKRDLQSGLYGAYFGGGFGGAMISAYDLERATPEKVVEIALNKGIDLRKYQV
jgi:hypothetical protein